MSVYKFINGKYVLTEGYGSVKSTSKNKKRIALAEMKLSDDQLQQLMSAIQEPTDSAEQSGPATQAPASSSASDSTTTPPVSTAVSAAPPKKPPAQKKPSNAYGDEGDTEAVISGAEQNLDMKKSNAKIGIDSVYDYAKILNLVGNEEDTFISTIKNWAPANQIKIDDKVFKKPETAPPAASQPPAAGDASGDDAEELDADSIESEESEFTNADIVEVSPEEAEREKASGKKITTAPLGVAESKYFRPRLPSKMVRHPSLARYRR